MITNDQQALASAMDLVGYLRSKVGPGGASQLVEVGTAKPQTSSPQKSWSLEMRILCTLHWEYQAVTIQPKLDAMAMLPHPGDEAEWADLAAATVEPNNLRAAARWLKGGVAPQAMIDQLKLEGRELTLEEIDAVAAAMRKYGLLS